MGRLTLIKAAVLLLCSAGLVMEALALLNCETQISQLEPCLSFVSGEESTPPKLCCDAFKSVVAAQPVCLCELLGGNLSLPSAFNVTLANELPYKCNVAVDQAQCPALINGVPSSSPLPSEAAGPGANPPGPSNDASRKNTISTILQLAAVVSLIHVYLQP